MSLASSAVLPPLSFSRQCMLTSEFHSIVAVHGLNFLNHDNHGEKTWLKGDKLWIRDFLPEALDKPCKLLTGSLHLARNRASRSSFAAFIH